MYLFVLGTPFNPAHITHVPVRRMRRVIFLTTTIPNKTANVSIRIGFHRSPSGKLVHNRE